MLKNMFYLRWYHWHESFGGKVLRLGLLVMLVGALYLTSMRGRDTSLLLFVLNLFLMLELFVHFKLGKMRPAQSVNEGVRGWETATLPVVSELATHQTHDALAHLLRLPQTQFLLERIGIAVKDVPIHTVTRDDLLKNSIVLVQEVKGRYVTSMDVVAAYLRCIEPEAKILFAKNLKEADLLAILAWARMDFPDEEHPLPTRAQFGGEGFGEELVTGWTPETKKFTQNFTDKAVRNHPLRAGRERELTAMIEVLSKPERNNVLLVGEAGSGKENLIAALTEDSLKGKLPPKLNHKNVLELMVGLLIAGVSERSELEVRLQLIIDEVSHAENVILYIPDVQNIIGASSYNLDISGALLPYLQDGRLPIIAATTMGNYKKYLEHNPLKDVFTELILAEPAKDQALLMLLEKTRELEEKYHALIPYKTVLTAGESADKYLADTVLPGSGVKLLEDASQRAAIRREQVIGGRVVVTPEIIMQVIEEQTHIKVLAPSAEEKDLLLQLEARLHERIIGQDAAVKGIAEAVRRYRTGLKTAGRPISFLFLGPTGVGKTETAKALADLYFGGQGHLVRLDMSEFAGDDALDRLLGAPPGKGEERGELTDKVHDNPASLILLDELEKASSQVHNIFLQVLADGRLTDNKGRTVSFVNTIIIATSNAGSEFVREEVGKGSRVDKAFQQKLLEHLQANHLFKPELLNRFDEIVTFMPLQPDEAARVVKLLLGKLTQTLAKEDIQLTIDDSVIKKVATEGYDQEFGARPLERYIQDTIEDVLAKKKLQDEIKRGDRVVLSIDANNNLQLNN